MRNQRRMVVPAQPVELVQGQYVEPRRRYLPYPAAPIVGAVAGVSCGLSPQAASKAAAAAAIRA